MSYKRVKCPIFFLPSPRYCGRLVQRVTSDGDKYPEIKKIINDQIFQHGKKDKFPKEEGCKARSKDQGVSVHIYPHNLVI